MFKVLGRHIHKHASAKENVRRREGENEREKPLREKSDDIRRKKKKDKRALWAEKIRKER